MNDTFNDRRIARTRAVRTQFGENLSKLATERGWTQSELARRADVTRNAVSNYVRGTYLPDAVSLKKLADAFDMKPDALMPKGVEPASFAMRSDPPLEIRPGADPTTSWLRINRLVHSAGLSEILAAIEKHAVTAVDD